MSEDFPMLILTVLLMCGIGCGFSTVWFLFQGCVKSCRISQTVYCTIGGIACASFMTIDSTAYQLSLGTWITIGTEETLNIAWRFRIDRLAAASLLILYSSIGIVVAMSWNDGCPNSKGERSLVTGTAVGLSVATLFFLAGDLYLLFLAWLGLNGVTFLLANDLEIQNGEPQYDALRPWSPVSGCITDVGFLLAVCISSVSLRALELPEVVALSTMESLFSDNHAMIDMIGLGIAIAVLGRSLQFPFLVNLPRLSDVDLRRFWVILMVTIVTPTIFLSLKFFELWHFGAVIPNQISTLGAISAFYFGLLATMTSKPAERTVALSLMAMSLFWMACGYRSFDTVIVAISFVVVAVSSIVWFSTESFSKPVQNRWSVVGLLLALFLFLILWTFFKVLRSGEVQNLDQSDGCMAGILLLSFASLTRHWLQSNIFHQSDSQYPIASITSNRLLLFAGLTAVGFGLPILMNAAGDLGVFSKAELRRILLAGAIALLPIALMAMVAGAGLGFWLNKILPSTTTSCSGSAHSLVRVIQKHFYVPVAFQTGERFGSAIFGPLIRFGDKRIFLSLPNQLISICSKNFRLAVERVFFSEESLMIAAAVMSIVILSVTLIW